MSITGALSNALSGLTITSKSAQITASNVANAMTDGYAVREAIISPRYAGDEGGVSFLGISRSVNEVLIADRRDAEAAFAKQNAINISVSRIHSVVGKPSESGSLLDRLNQFEASLIEATAAPENENFLNNIGRTAASLANKINEISDAIQTERSRADFAIEHEVQNLNSTLQKIQDLNGDIKKHGVVGHDTSALLDQRQTLVDQVNETIPVSVIQGQYGDISLITVGGVYLLDGTAKNLEFDAANAVTPHSSVVSGELSSLSVNGIEISTASSANKLGQGRLQGLFSSRDEVLVEWQSSMDGLARELVERLQVPSVVGTSSSGIAGFFTDGGNYFDASNEQGLAQRLQLNDLINPDEIGEIWRIRDGLSAATQGQPGTTSQIIEMLDAMSETVSPKSSEFGTTAKSIYTLFADTVNGYRSVMSGNETLATYHQVKLQALQQTEASQGVDSDHEMQRLLLIEQSYNANVRVIQVVDEMLAALMRI